jgi:cold shock protein
MSDPYRSDAATATRERGTVKKWEHGATYGFIARGAGAEDVFVHFTAIKAEPGKYRTLTPGQSVTFTVEKDSGGKGWKAVDVEVVG